MELGHGINTLAIVPPIAALPTPRTGRSCTAHVQLGTIAQFVILFPSPLISNREVLSASIVVFRSLNTVTRRSFSRQLGRNSRLAESRTGRLSDCGGRAGLCADG